MLPREPLLEIPQIERRSGSITRLDEKLVLRSRNSHVEQMWMGNLAVVE